MSNNTHISAATTRVTRFLDLWHRAEVAIALVAFTLIACLMTYDVLSRELFAPVLRILGFDAQWLTLYGSQKMGVYLLIAGAFTGIGIATAQGAQLIPKVAFSWLPQSWNAVIERLADTITALFLCAVTYVAWTFVDSSREIGVLTSGGISIEAWKIQAAIPLGFASAAVRYIAYAIWPYTKPVIEEHQE